MVSLLPIKTIRVPGVQRPHPTLGEVVALLLVTPLSIVGVMVTGLTLVLSTLPAIVLGCSSAGAEAVRATIADLILQV